MHPSSITRQPLNPQTLNPQTRKPANPQPATPQPRNPQPRKPVMAGLDPAIRSVTVIARHTHGSRSTMMRRSKEASGPPGRPETSWLAGAMIGMTITTLAAGAMMLGVGMALGQAAPINRLPSR
jgi:hypothetical protein